MRSRLTALLLTAASGATGGCSFDHGGLPSTDAFVDPGDDGGGVAQLWRDDSADDFAPGTLAQDAVVESWGAIGPAAWLTGGLRARASNDAQFTDPAAATWAALEQIVPAGVGFSELQPVVYGTDRPRGIGLTTSETWTVWYDGEVWLDPGEHTWSLTVDDAAFLELAAPGTAEFTRVVGATAAATMLASYQASVAGWHPIRVGFTEVQVDADLAVLLEPPGGNLPVAIPRDRLRVRADALTGLHWLGFDDSLLGAPRLGPFLYDDPAFEYSPSNGDVTALGFTDAERFAMRWSGQLRVDIAGAYAFELISNDGQRMWIDGTAVLDFWAEAPQTQTTAPIELDVGWHDVIIDLAEGTGAQDLRLRIDAGPELTGENLPVARLRPVAPRLERTADAIGAPDLIFDNSITEIDLAIAAPTGATSIAVDVSYTIDHSAWDDLEIEVVSPDGAQYPLLADQTSTLTGRHTVRHAVVTAGATVGGVWKLVVTDNATLDIGDVEAAAMTARYRGGEPPIATLAVYESAIEELGAAIGLDRVSWAGRLPAGSSVAVRMRTCDAIGGCPIEPWSEPVTTSGASPAVLARRFAQYRIELTGDGDVAPWLDWIEIGYRAAAP